VLKPVGLVRRRKWLIKIKSIQLLAEVLGFVRKVSEFNPVVDGILAVMCLIRSGQALAYRHRLLMVY
jgi:hypothetical protein